MDSVPELPGMPTLRALLSTSNFTGNLTSEFYADVMGFYHAVDWTERWLLVLGAFHALFWVAAILTRRFEELQMVLLVLIRAFEPAVMGFPCPPARALHH